MKESYSGLFRRDSSVPVSGLRRVPSGPDISARKLPSGVIQKPAVAKPKPTHSSNVGGREEFSDEPSAHTRAKSQGGYVTDPSGRITKYPKPANEAKRVAPAVQIGAGGEDSVKDKETDKASNVGPAMDWAQKTASELREAWWCGTPALEAKKKKADTFTTNPPENTDNWVANRSTLNGVMEAAKAKAKPASKPKPKPASKAKPASAKPEKSGDEKHAALLIKMAKAVTNSTVDGISPKHILAAGYALHTFHPDTLATPKETPKSKPKPKHESVEQIVNDFLEDTLSGDVGTIALGFAPVGQLDPRKNPDILRPGGKKKKRTNQYRKLAQMVAGNMSGV